MGVVSGDLTVPYLAVILYVKARHIQHTLGISTTKPMDERKMLFLVCYDSDFTGNEGGKMKNKQLKHNF